jgi:hypothetical protein
MSEEIKISDVLLRAAEVIVSRDGDTTTEDGDFACVDIDSIIHLESDISKLFSLNSDDVLWSDLPIIKDRAQKYDHLVKENKRLWEALRDSHAWLGIDVDYAESPLQQNNEQLLSEQGGDK